MYDQALMLYADIRYVFFFLKEISIVTFVGPQTFNFYVVTAISHKNGTGPQTLKPCNS